MITGKTESGFEFEIADNVGDSYDLLEAIGRMEDGDAFALPVLCKALLGSAGHKALKDHCRKDGTVSTEAITHEIVEIFGAVKSQPDGDSVKNS